MSSTTPRPTWASQVALSDYTEFLRAIRVALARHGLKFTVHEHGIEVTHPDGERTLYGMSNLVRDFLDARRSRRDAVVSRHFETLVRARTEMDQINAQLKDFNVVRDKMKVRLHPESYRAQCVAAKIHSRVPARGIVATLVCDLGRMNVSLNQDTTKPWGLTEDELFALALKNVRAEGRLDLVPSPDPSFPCDAFEGGTYYAATRALFLDEYLDANDRLGYVVAVPSRYVILHHKIRDRSILSVLPRMQWAVDEMVRREPGPISPLLYWWRGGVFKEMDMGRVGEQAVFRPTEEFENEVFKRLMELEKN